MSRVDVSFFENFCYRTSQFNDIIAGQIRYNFRFICKEVLPVIKVGSGSSRACDWHDK
jgi:hypothetical protein